MRTASPMTTTTLALLALLAIATVVPNAHVQATSLRRADVDSNAEHGTLEAMGQGGGTYNLACL